MVYYSNCGEKIDDNAYFCPKCGSKTPAGKASNASYPADELRDAFYKVGIALECASIWQRMKPKLHLGKQVKICSKKHPLTLLTLKDLLFVPVVE